MLKFKYGPNRYKYKFNIASLKNLHRTIKKQLNGDNKIDSAIDVHFIHEHYILITFSSDENIWGDSTNNFYLYQVSNPLTAIKEFNLHSKCYYVYTNRSSYGETYLQMNSVGILKSYTNENENKLLLFPNIYKSFMYKITSILCMDIIHLILFYSNIYSL